MHLFIPSITPSREQRREERILAARKSIDVKIISLVLDRISQHKGGVLSSTHVHEVTIQIPPVKSLPEGAFREKKKSRPRKGTWVRKAPLGLLPVESEGWFNALMQFMLFVPGLAELFCFAPRSLSPIRDFIDIYQQDQQENRQISSVNGSALYRFLCLKFPEIHFLELFQYLVLLLQPKWKIYQRLGDVKNGSEHLFVTEGQLKKQFFTESGYCYDLNAFIERRPDGDQVNYVAYVKVEGSWYQCDDERILQLRSDMLPLQRGALAHFKKVSFRF